MKIVIKRFFAFILDSLIVSLICSLFFVLLVDNNKMDKLTNELSYTYDSFIEERIDDEAFFNQVSDISYDILRASSLFSIVSIGINICYFVVYQYRNGQTIGKKVFKIRVYKCDKELTINDFIYRTFIGNMILFNLLNVIMLLFLSKDVYNFVNMALINIEFLVLFICVVMTIFRKDHRGLHDLIGHTKVVNI